MTSMPLEPIRRFWIEQADDVEIAASLRIEQRGRVSRRSQTGQVHNSKRHQVACSRMAIAFETLSDKGCHVPGIPRKTRRPLPVLPWAQGLRARACSGILSKKKTISSRCTKAPMMYPGKLVSALPALSAPAARHMRLRRTWSRQQRSR